ncbi:MAG: NHL repeat-containing protein [Candidatus Dormibacteria bacterium]
MAAPSTLQLALNQQVFDLPTDFQSPSSLAADPIRTGVWFVTGSASIDEFVYVSAQTGNNHIYPFDPAGTSELDFTGGIGVAPDGSVWAGWDLTVVHLVPATGAVTRYTVPVQIDDPTAEAYRSPQTKGDHFITSLAVNRSGDVALAIDAASQVTVLHGGQFQVWPLPEGTDANQVAYLADGTLGANLDDYPTHHTDELATFTPLGHRSVSSGVYVPNLAAVGGRFISVGAATLTSFDTLAHASPAVPLTGLGAAKPVDERPVTVLPSGDVAMASTDGVIVVNVTTGATSDDPLPKDFCLPASAPRPPLPSVATYPPASALCPVVPELLSADGQGTIWLKLPEAQGAIASLDAAGY